MTIDTNRTLPWEDNGSGIICGQCQGEDDDAPFIADVCDSPLEFTAFEHCKAEFIVRACNAHNDLLAACEAFAEAFKDSADFADCPLAKARMAIAKAKGGRQ